MNTDKKFLKEESKVKDSIFSNIVEETIEDTTIEETSKLKRKRGRPKGSLEKKTLIFIF